MLTNKLLKILPFIFLFILYVNCSKPTKNKLSVFQIDSSLNKDSSQKEIIAIDSTIVKVTESQLAEFDKSKLLDLIQEKKLLPDSFNITNLEFISNNITDIKNINSSKENMVAIVEAGYGYYSGINDCPYENMEVLLILFHSVDSVYVIDVTKSVWSYQNVGLKTGRVKATAIQFFKDKNAVSLVYTYSEEGAGDYSWKEEITEFFVLDEIKIKSIFKETTLKEEYSGDESGNYINKKSKAELKFKNNSKLAFCDFEFHIKEEIDESIDGVKDLKSNDYKSFYKWTDNQYVKTVIK